MNLIKALLLLVVAGILGAAAFVYFGVFNAAADVPHWPFVYHLMETVRQRSIAVRAKDIQVPPLDDPAMIADGAEHYSAMCTGCHLAPGVTDSEIRPGLYPQPPNLSQHLHASPAEMFWTIKHGIKMSAMPAWGATHDDQAIWGMVAFLQKLPELTPHQYQALAHSTSEGEGHHHHHGEAAGEPDPGAAGEHLHEHAAGAGETQEDAHGEADEHHHEPPATDTGEAHGHTHSEADAHHHPHDADAGKVNAAAASKVPEDPISLDGLKPQAVPDAEAVATAFHRALQQGDRDGVLALLSADVTVSEAGHTQSRSQYASGHLGEDIAFLKSVDVKPLSLASMPMGESAMVGSESEIRAKVGGPAKIQRSRELLTLKRQDGAWKIVAVRWESVPDATADHPAGSHDHP